MVPFSVKRVSRTASSSSLPSPPPHPHLLPITPPAPPHPHLLPPSAAVSKCDADGISPLMEAVRRGMTKLVIRLMVCGVNLSHVDKQGRNVLMYCAE